jgi:hypothetical protein
LNAELAAAGDSVRQLTEDVVRWRAAALTRWTDALAVSVPTGPGQSAEAEHLRQELAAIRATLSWRVTRPLRAVRRIRPARGRR